MNDSTARDEDSSPEIPIALPLVRAAWPSLLEIVPDLGLCELQCLIISKRPAFDHREWARVVAGVNRLFPGERNRNVALAHLLRVAKGGRN